jgi:hypothetical protein
MGEAVLKRDAIGVSGVVAMSLGVMALASGMMFTPAVVAGHAGPALPLVYLLSLAGVALGALWIWPPWPATLITVPFAWMLVGLVAGYRLRSRSGETLERIGRLLAS